MSRSKKHHQVPQFYLRSFADVKERVTVFDRHTQKSFNQHLREVATESNLYTVVGSDGNPSDEFEKHLSWIEGNMVESVRKLLQITPELNLEDRSNIGAFVALQFIRTSPMRDQFENIIDLSTRMMVEANLTGDPPERVERFIEKRYAEHPQWFKDEVRKVAADPTLSVSLPTDAWVDHFTPQIIGISRMLTERDWWIAHADERSFVTSDDPISLIVGPDDPVGGVGIATAFQILLPLSPFRVLVIEAYQSGALHLEHVDRDWIAWANRTIANSSNRQVFWHPKSHPLSKIVVTRTPRPSIVNGLPVQRGERSWDKLRHHKLPGMLRMRDEIRSRHSSEAGESNPID